MRYLYFSESTKNKEICILSNSLNQREMRRTYLAPYGIDSDEVIAIELYMPKDRKKPSAAEMRSFIEDELIEELQVLGTKYVICTNADYFRLLSGGKKADPSIGYVYKSPLGDFFVSYAPSVAAVFYDPEKGNKKIARTMGGIADHRQGTYTAPGEEIFRTALYPQGHAEIAAGLRFLLDLNQPLTCDIEAFDLRADKAGIGTIAFAWNQHEGMAFCVDYEPIAGATEAPYGRNKLNNPVRELLINFFVCFKNKIIYHNISYDAYVLIYQLFMEDIIDTEGLLYGIETMLSNWDDTKLISYLATNTCAGNHLSLKEQAQEFAGNYAIDEIKDITAIPAEKLLKYNLVDALSTWFVYDKNYPKMVADDQEDIYINIFKPAILDIIQMQLTGLPLNMDRVIEVEKQLTIEVEKSIQTISSNNLVQEFIYILNEDWVIKRNSQLKKKRVSIADAKETFNPRSDQQLQKLLYSFIGLPVIELTESKQPATGGSVLKSLISHTNNKNIIELLEALRNFKLLEKVITSFIPAMKNAIPAKDGWHYMTGNFNLGGTVSGRLSSNSPNMQNMPAKGKLGKLIKSCFSAPKGWLLCGLDFSSLEDRISALTTKDFNKLKVYTDKFDGHCLRAFSYFGDQMPDIDGNSVEGINSIEHKYSALRQESKTPTFLLTYGGSWRGLMSKVGFSEEKAKFVEARYKELYKTSIDWVQDKLDQASKCGFVVGAFGLRLRTPLLRQVIRGTSKTPYEAEAEGRTAGNALGQSWCLLNSRAWSATMKIVRDSEYRLDIRLCAQIHDAGYALVRDDVNIIRFLNEHIVREVNWNNHPDIYHPEVGLGGELSIFYPSWEKELTIPNGASEAEIFSIVEKSQK